MGRLTCDRPWRLGLPALLAAALLTSVAASPIADSRATAAASSAVASDTASSTNAAATSVTLITGDRVLVRRTSGGGHAIEVRPGPGREQMLFQKLSLGRQSIVLPLDAAPLVAAGVLDPRLFDVKLLLRYGFDDATSPTLPLLLQYDAKRTAGAARSALPSGTRIVRDLPLVDAVAAAPDKGSLDELWRSWSSDTSGSRAALPAGVSRVWLDGGVRPTLDRSVRQIAAPTAWRAGYTGRGVTVAVLDTGLDTTHPDLADAVVETANFTSEPNVADQVGHGTHVASTVAGSGAASDGRYQGVAPDAELLVGKVCEIRGCTLSSIIAGMQWAADNGARVVNMSLGGGPTDGTDPLSAAVDELTAKTGALFVVSAGNSGRAETVGSPGSADSALTVGSVTKSNKLSPFSSRGPRVGDHALKPDLTAPGSRIVAARADGTLPELAVGPDYAELSGTSMAAPHVAGAAAILAQQHPRWRAGRLKAALTGSAQPLAGLDVFEQGAGRLDVADAIEQPVTTRPASLNLGVTSASSDGPIRRVVTYRNHGDHAVTLRLRLDVDGPDGRPAPGRMFTLSRHIVRVPAGGSTSVAVTADTRRQISDGDYAGWLVTRDWRGNTTRTAVGLYRKPPSYQQTITMLDRHGNPAGSTDKQVAVATLVNLDTAQLYGTEIVDGSATIRLPAGRYALHALVGTFRPGAEGQGYIEGVTFPEPTIEVDEDAEIVLDGRRANRVRTVRPVKGASATTVGVGYVRPVGDLVFNAAVAALHPVVEEAMPKVFVTPNRTGSRREFTGFAQVMWAKMPKNPHPYEKFWLNSPYLYHDVAAWPGRIPSRPVLDTPRGDYAHVDASYAASRADQYATKYGYPYLPVPGRRSGLVGAYVFVSNVEMSLPFQRDEYYAVDGGHRWAFELMQFRYTGGHGQIAMDQTLYSNPIAYRSGSHHRERWNAAVFAPRLPRPQVGYVAERLGSPWAFRDGDTLSIGVPMFGDAGTRRMGDALHKTERTTLSSGGRRIASSDALYQQTFRVPADRRWYTLSKRVTRPANRYPLSTRVESAWRFRSARVTDGTERPLPLLTVGYAPRLNPRSCAPSGMAFRVPVTVERQFGSGTGRPHVRRLTVAASYDGGATWQRAPVRRTKSGWSATLRHPAKRGYVSLRAKAVDSAGNRVRQDVIRAYRLGC